MPCRARAFALVPAITACALLAPASAPAAPVVGLGDQLASSFSDPRLRALGMPVARLVVPYDAAISQPARVEQWLAASSAAGMAPHVAFEHLRGDRCPSAPCTTPTRAAYAAAVRGFIARFAQVRTYTTWNEANHQSQPVASRPEAVAGYYEELRAACPACTVVAGDVLDSGTYVRWLQRLQSATRSAPQLWGLHNYGDVTYGTTEGTDAVLAAVPGELWIEETGGIVALRNGSRETLPYDETRAAESVERAFALLTGRPRITRMYVYHWQGTVGGRFDAGLIRADGSLRPSYAALARGLAGQASATAAAENAATAVRWTATWSRIRPRQLVLRARCLTRGGRCTGRVAPSIRTRRGATARSRTATLAMRSYRTSATRRTRTLRITIGRPLRARLRSARTRTLRLRVRPATPSGTAYTVTLRLARPR